MAESLRKLLISGYDELRRRLALRLGSTDAATEVLHEMWLRLDSGADIRRVREPRAYLYRMAVNVAIDRHRADVRWLDKALIEAQVQVGGQQPDPERIASAKSELVALERALAELPPRRRAVFMAALVEGLPYREIAERLGISLRSVEREMSRALEHCNERLQQDSLREASQAGGACAQRAGGTNGD